MEMLLPNEVKEIINVLEQAGYEAYAVGGCVRDSLLLKEPKDYDITTNALPEEVKSLFSRTVDTGIQHGTVTVLINKTGYEVTTYRIDGEYEDGRHPKDVTYTKSLREDLRRRDFTINAMAFSDRGGLVDLFDGEKDLEMGIIRCVGNAVERFTEDALRMLRAVRFAAQLGFKIEEETYEAMKLLHSNLKKVSVERIYTEFYKTLISDHPEHIEIMYDTGLLSIFLPELDDCFEDKKRRDNLLKKLVRSEKVLWTREAILFAEIDTENDDIENSKHVQTILRRLKTDRDTMYSVSSIVSLRKFRVEKTQVAVRKLLSKYGENTVNHYLAFLEADDSIEQSYIEAIRGIVEVIIKRGDCISIGMLKVDGRDIMSQGVPSGKMVGNILEYLLELVIEHPEYNERDVLLSQVRDGMEDL